MTNNNDICCPRFDKCVSTNDIVVCYLYTIHDLSNAAKSSESELDAVLKPRNYTVRNAFTHVTVVDYV